MNQIMYRYYKLKVRKFQTDLMRFVGMEVRKARGGGVWNRPDRIRVDFDMTDTQDFPKLTSHIFPVAKRGCD